MATVEPVYVDFGNPDEFVQDLLKANILRYLLAYINTIQDTIRSFAVRAFTNMARYEETRSELTNYDAVESILSLSSESNDASIRQFGIQLITQLGQEKSYRRKLVHSGRIDMLLQQATSSDVITRRVAAMGFNDAASNPSEWGRVTSIITIESAHPIGGKEIAVTTSNGDKGTATEAFRIDMSMMSAEERAAIKRLEITFDEQCDIPNNDALLILSSLEDKHPTTLSTTPSSGEIPFKDIPGGKIIENSQYFYLLYRLSPSTTDADIGLRWGFRLFVTPILDEKRFE